MNVRGDWRTGALVILGLLLVLVLTLAAFGIDVRVGLPTIVKGAAGDWFGITKTLVRFIPLCLIGLGILVAWKAGMFSVGGEGQYVLGGIGGATIFAMFGPGLGALSAPLMMILGAGFGLGLGMLAGWLELRRGVPVVISTILLNFIAIELMAYLVRGPLQEPKRQLFQSATLPDAVMLARFDRQTDLHAGIFVAILAVVGVGIYLNATWGGFRLKVVGDSPSAARANRMNADRTRMEAMAISGALCGLAGAVDYVGLSGRLADGFAQGWGFMSIPVALLGGLNPFGTGVAALFFGGLLAGCEQLKRDTAIGNTLVPVVQGVAVMAFVAILRWREWRAKRAEVAP